MTSIKKPEGLSLEECEILTYQNVNKRTLRNTQYRNPSDLSEDTIIIRNANGLDGTFMTNQRKNFYLLQEKKTSDLQKEILKNLSLDELNSKKIKREKISKSFNTLKKREVTKQNNECSALWDDFFGEDPKFSLEEANENLTKQKAHEKMIVQRAKAQITKKLGGKYSKEYLQSLVLKQELENAKTESEIIFTENEIDRLKLRFKMQN